MGKNIVVCCDGTGNEVTGNLSNVLKLYRIVRQDEQQRVFYSPGVGTIGDDNPWLRRLSRFRAAFGLATGAGLDANILDGYDFLIKNYKPGDRIYLFGFSRGAYTVRAIAALIHAIGILRADQLNLARYALTAYKRAGEEGKFELAWSFGRVAGTLWAPIHFLGVWDTVASMIIPRPDRFYFPSLGTLPFTRYNPSVRAFRHAMAIDERRRMFRLNRWKSGTMFIADPFIKPPDKIPQDVKQVWFAGVHADVGGGYPETESGLSKYPLIWMIEEAAAHGLEIDQLMFEHLAQGKPLPKSQNRYVPPAPAAILHNSLSRAWLPLEWLPKKTRWREWPERRSVFGFYLPRGEPRFIGPQDVIAPSVEERKGVLNSYRPKNLPK